MCDRALLCTPFRPSINFCDSLWPTMPLLLGLPDYFLSIVRGWGIEGKEGIALFLILLMKSGSTFLLTFWMTQLPIIYRCSLERVEVERFLDLTTCIEYMLRIIFHPYCFRIYSILQDHSSQMYAKLIQPFIRSKSLQRTTAFFFASFPYQFGGLDPQHSYVATLSHKDGDGLSIYQKNRLYMQQVFGDDIEENFASAYRQIVRGLHNKDEELISSVMGPTLARGLADNRDLKTRFLNEDAKIITHIGQIHFMMGMQFDRRNLEDLEASPSYSADDTFSTVKIFNRRLNAPEDIRNLLFTVNVVFESQMRLTREESQQDKQEDKQEDRQENNLSEFHSVQFQIGHQIEIRKFISTLFREVGRNLFRPSKITDALNNYLIIGEEGEFEWKVGDMDYVLRGNFPKTVK